MFVFRAHTIDTTLPGRLYAQTALADMDGDGLLVYITGQQYGTIFGYRISSEWVVHEIRLPDDEIRGVYHSLYAGDLDGDGDIDVLSSEMEGIPGEGKPRYFIWENVDGKGMEWREHVVFDGNLGGHATVVADVTGNGLPDIISKPSNPRADNAVGGRNFVLFLENMGTA